MVLLNPNNAGGLSANVCVPRYVLQLGTGIGTVPISGLEILKNYADQRMVDWKLYVGSGLGSEWQI